VHVHVQVPLERWDIERLYSPDLAAGKMYTRLGAWLTAIGQFDGAMFGMHHSEAVATDPQVLSTLAARVATHDCIESWWASSLAQSCSVLLVVAW